MGFQTTFLGKTYTVKRHKWKGKVQMNVQLFLVWTKESFWLRNGGSTNSTMFSSRRSAKCPVLKPRQRRLQVYCTHGQEGNLCLYKCFTNRGVATCTHGTHVRTRLHREVHPYLLFWERWKKGEKTKKERKKHIHFDSSGGFRCPRRASSYETRMIKSEKYRISWTNCLHYKTLRNYEASDSL